MADIIPGASFFRTALVGEAWLNVMGSLPLIFFPRATLGRLLVDGRASTVGHEQLLQMLGVVFAGLAVPLFKASADTPEGVALRKTTYLTLGTIEAVLGGLLVKQLAAADPVALASGAALKPAALIALLGVFGVALVWRTYTTIIRPDLAGWVVTTAQYRKRE